MKQYLYLLVNLLSVFLPFVFSFHPRLMFVAHWKSFWPACALVSTIFIAWDYYFTSIGVWGFNREYLLNIFIGKLPLEEILFFICIPYACLFSYHCSLILLKKDPFAGLERTLSILIGFLLMFIGCAYWNLWYTSVTFLSCGSFLLLHSFYFRFRWMSKFYLCYLFILPLFFLTNGILTGGFTEKPVVWYNNAENLGIRLLTIPIEDVFYGFLLLSLNLALFERLKLYFSREKEVPITL